MKEFKPVKTALIGCGVISKAYLENTVKQFKILDVVGCSDLIPERSAQRAEEFGIRQMTNEEILSDPSIELVINTTYPTQHFPVAKLALEAGKHVYTEKMIAQTLAEAQTLKALADRKKLFCCGAPDTFLGAGLQTARQIIDSGIIGTPVAASILLARCYHQERSYVGKEKRFTLCPSGGILYDLGSYYLTFLLSLLGGIDSVCGFSQIRNPNRVYMNPGSPNYGQPFQSESNNNNAGALLFKNGTVASLMLTTENAVFHNSLIIYGTDGQLDLGDPNHFGTRPKLTTKFTEAVDLPLTHAYIEGELRGLGVAELAYSIRNGRVPRTEIQMPMHALEAVLGIINCSETGRVYKMTTGYTRPETLPAGHREYPELSLYL